MAKIPAKNPLLLTLSWKLSVGGRKFEKIKSIIKCCHVNRSYTTWKKSRRTQKTKLPVRKRWLNNGDYSKYNEGGFHSYVFVVDRPKRMIKVNGLQVDPSELEHVVRQCPGVYDVTVVGVSNEQSEELPRAYVIRKDNDVLEKTILDFVDERVAQHKRLGAGVMFIDNLPRNTENVFRRELNGKVFEYFFP